MASDDEAPTLRNQGGDRKDDQNAPVAVPAAAGGQPGGLVPVTFLEMYAPYNAGETAGVDADLAARLVNAGKATYYGVVREDGRPAFDGDQPVDLAVAPNHPMRSPSQLAEQQIPSDGRGHAEPRPGASVLPSPDGGVSARLDSSSGRDMAGTAEKDDKGSHKGKR